MNITFWKFNKQGNSTKRPNTAGTSYDNCVILRGSSIINPSLQMNFGVATAPDFNYCYIPDFGRYYYIQEWTYNNRLWEATLSVDALATYRGTIGSSNLYALRTSNSNLYDGRVVDTRYPAKVGSTFNRVNGTNNWTTTNGVFVVGIVNSGLQDYRFGSVVYYIMNNQQFTDMINYLLSDNLINDFDFDWSDVGPELQKSVIDPLQYIKSCTYIPISATTISSEYTTQATVQVFSWDIYRHVSSLVLCPIVTRSKPSLSFTNTYNIPKHPQTTSRGNYVNTKPHTNLTLTVPPFGSFEIDTSVTSNASTLTLTTEIDMPTGLGILTVECNGIILNRIEAQIGIPVQLTQVTRDYIGGATATINGIAGSIGAFASGNILGGITGAVTSIGNAIESLTPRSQTIGSGGSYAQLTRSPCLEAQFFELVDDDIEKNGRPCCKIVNCSSGGYFLIQDGDVPISGTQAEWEMIKSSLESGFYWE